MKELTSGRKNRRALALLLVACIVAWLIPILPAYSFNAAVYTKKSSNTVVGDDKYQQALAEVNEVREQYISEGMETELEESVTERTNSKGETTSLVTFKLFSSFTKNGYDIFSAKFPASNTLKVILACMTLSLVCGAAGTVSTCDVQVRFLNKKSRVLRRASVVFALAAMLLVPVMIMMNTYCFSRRPKLYVDELVTEGKEEFYSQMDSFLFDGTAGDSMNAVLKGLSFRNLISLWGLLPCAVLEMIAGLQLSRGEIKEGLLKGVMYGFLIIVCIITLYPYYVMLVTGFRSTAETNDMYFLNIFPTKWIWSNFSDIVKRDVLIYLKNSLLIAGGATVVAMLCGIPAAYAMARKRFKGKKLFLGFVIMSQMFSPVVLMIGIYQLMSTIGLNDSIVGLMLINAAFNQAFAIWLLRGTFISISPEMEQAALIDGCNTMQSLTRVLLPMAAPGIVTTLIFVFINSWNEYTLSTVLISTTQNRPITVGITQFSSFNMIEWQYLFAASLIATIPVVILFVCIEKHLTSGLTSGGVKG